ncbi:MAG: hypothetical protein HQL29_06050 [Candidatus Omnitrophica bacterium]|nr:hypothetical protein [Candidatus Omnitrophota bacterium]
MYKLQVETSIKSQIKNDIAKRSPELSASQKESLASARFNDVKVTNKKDIDNAITNLKNNSKALYPLYLTGADSFFYLYLTKNILNKGAISDKITGGRYFLNSMLAPTGTWRQFELHPYLGYYFFRVLSLFNKLPLESILAAYPLLIFTITILILYCIYWNLKISYVPSFISGILFSLSPVYLQRSSFGWYDTDPYNVLFVLLAVFLLINFLSDSKNIIWIISLSFVSSFYALFWQGWLLLPALVILVFLFLLIRNMILKKLTVSLNLLKNLGIYLCGLFVFGSIFLTPAGIINSIKDIININKEFFFMREYSWPDILPTVGELKKTTWIKLLLSLGPVTLLPIACIGSLLPLLIKRFKTNSYIALSLSFLLLFLMAKNAQRFVLFLLPSAALLTAATLDFLKEMLYSIKIHKFFSHTITLIVCVLILAPLSVFAFAEAKTQMPIYNITWDETMTYISKNTPKDSIISSWWSPGHFIKAIGQRKVTFDGATINTPQAFWMSKVLLTSSETESISILHMLDTSGNEIAEKFLSKGIPLPETIALIEKLISTKSEKIMNVPSPPAYVMIYKDLVDSVLGLTYVNQWDFNKANKIKLSKKNNFLKTSFLSDNTDKNIDSIWEIAGGRPYIGEPSFPKETKEDRIIFDNGVIFNPALKIALFDKLENRVSGLPKSIYYKNPDGTVEQKNLKGSTLKLSVLFLDDSEGLRCIVAPEYILSSILFRLYYMNGYGLTHFKKVFETSNPIFKDKIQIYKVDTTPNSK